jgi:SnoaL-like protein
MPSPVDPVQRLEAVEEIKGLKARYFRCLDTKDWEGFAAVFSPDAVMDMAEAAGGDPLPDATSRGPRDIAAYVGRSVEGMVTVHHGHMPEIEVTGETTAEGVWAMEDLLRWTGPDGKAGGLHGFGHYHETYEKVDGRWLIASIRLTRLRVDMF